MIRKTLCSLVAALSVGCEIPRISGNYTFDKVDINYITRVEDRGSFSVNSVLEQFERIPDHVQRVGNRYGRVVLIDNMLTSEPEFSDLRDAVHPSAGAWNNIPGAYHSSTCSAFVYVYHADDEYLELHEYGHLIDACLNDISNHQRFRTIFLEVKNSYLSMFMDEHQLSSEQEFFANCFALYYYSDWSRESLERRIPKAGSFFRDLDDDLR